MENIWRFFTAGPPGKASSETCRLHPSPIPHLGDLFTSLVRHTNLGDVHLMDVFISSKRKWHDEVDQLCFFSSPDIYFFATFRAFFLSCLLCLSVRIQLFLMQSSDEIAQPYRGSFPTFLLKKSSSSFKRQAKNMKNN